VYIPVWKLPTGHLPVNLCTCYQGGVLIALMKNVSVSNKLLPLPAGSARSITGWDCELKGEREATTTELACRSNCHLME
jgi:hypothetical protein